MDLEEALGGVAKPSARERRKVVETSNRVFGTVRGSLLFASLVWLTMFLVSVCTGIESWSLSIREATLDIKIVEAEAVTVSGPMPDNVQLTSLSCRAHQMFAANRYQVFSLNATSGEAQVYPCDVKGEIRDLTIACTGSACRPVVLLDSSKVLDCGTGSTMPLLQGLEAESIALQDATIEGDLLAWLPGGAVTEAGWDPFQRGWSPLWSADLGVSTGTVSVDAVGDLAFDFFVQERHNGHSFVFRNGIAVFNLTSKESPRGWHHRDNDYTTTAGCAMTRNEVYLLQAGDEESALRLLRCELPPS